MRRCGRTRTFWKPIFREWNWSHVAHAHRRYRGVARRGSDAGKGAQKAPPVSPRQARPFVPKAAGGRGPSEPIFAGGWIELCRLTSAFLLAPQAIDIAACAKYRNGPRIHWLRPRTRRNQAHAAASKNGFPKAPGRRAKARNDLVGPGRSLGLAFLDGSMFRTVGMTPLPRTYLRYRVPAQGRQRLRRAAIRHSSRQRRRRADGRPP